MQLAERYLFAPLSILNATTGAWRDRRRAWEALGLEDDATRAGPADPAALATGGLCFDKAQIADPWFYQKKAAAEADLGRTLTAAEFAAAHPEAVRPTLATSRFDPVLAELGARWWSPRGGAVLDPFAGGATRGVVSCLLGRSYWGCDLRAEQVESNRVVAERVMPEGELRPVWVAGDAREVAASAPESDLLLTCPPYADLEVYSEDPRDLSRMRYPEFAAALAEALALACSRLRPDSFAVLVLGEARSSRGPYYGIVPDAIRAMTRAGMTFESELVHVGPIASHAVRCRRMFDASRRVPKHHQNVLVFAKGCAKRAAKRCGEVEVGPVPSGRAAPCLDAAAEVCSEPCPQQTSTPPSSS